MDNEIQKEEMAKEPKQRKIDLKKLAIILIIVAVVLVVGGIGGSAFIKYYQEKKAEENKALAKSIFEQTGMDDYLTDVFVPGVTLDSNLLESDVKLQLEVYNDESIPKYSFYYSEDDTIAWLYVKYADYAVVYEKLFGKSLDFEAINSEMAFPELTALGDNKYVFNMMRAVPCSDENVDSCYVSISQLEISNKQIKFDSFDLKDNIVTGKVQLTYDYSGSKYSLNGDFELKYTENNDSYSVDYIKIISVEENSLS